MVSLTRQQARVLEFIGEHLSHVGRPPTLREIAGAFMMASTNGPKCHLRALERKGYIERSARAARGIRLKALAATSAGITVIGRAVAGTESCQGVAAPPDSVPGTSCPAPRPPALMFASEVPRAYNRAGGSSTHHQFVARNDMAKERYEEKFQDFIKVIAEARRQGTPTVVVQRPEVLGDTHEELIESLNRLAEAGLTLTVVPPSERTAPRDSFRWS
jgi:DNA-binding MarR family transcriptional regulator